MRKVIAFLVVGFIVGLVQPGFAQDLVEQTPPRFVQPKPAAPQAPTPTPTPTAPPATLPTPVAQKDEREPIKTGPPKMTNVQVEITITDQIGTGAPNKKTVQLITSDGSMGRIRSRAETMSNRGAPMSVNLNVDAMPRVVGDQVQLNLTIEYNPLKTSADGTSEEKSVSPTQLNQSLSVVMTSSKWMTISQAADPVTDRKIIVECKATILK